METINTILLKSGKITRQAVRISMGAAFIGDPTAYIIYEGQTVWVWPGESVEWIEA
jgi:hypothetical protein